MPDESTTKFKVDISELKKGMQEAARQVRMASSEFKAATAGMDNWGKSADGISAKVKQLESVLDSQNSQLEILQKQYDLVAKGEGETSKGAQELLIKINNQKAAIGKTNAELNKWRDALSKVDSEQDETISATDKLKDSISKQESELTSLKKKYVELALTQGRNSTEAKQTAQAISELSSDLSKNKQALSKAEGAADDLDESMDDLGESAKDAGGGFTIFKGVVADLISSGVKSLISGFAGLAESTYEYRTAMGKLDTAFETNGYSTKAAKDAYEELNSVLNDSDVSVEAANHLAKLTDNEKDLATWTGSILPGVFATFGDSLPIEGLTEAANETAKVGQVTGPLADALNWAGISEDKFNEKLAKCSDEQERQKLIMDTLNKTYSEASDHYKETNKDVITANKAQTELTEKYAALGEKATPIITAIKQGMADLLGAALGLVDGVDFSQVATKVQGGFSYLIDEVVPKIKEGFQWILDHKDLVIGSIAGIAGGFLAWKAIGVASMIKGMIVQLIALVSAQEGATVAQKLLNLAMNANPIGIIITIVTALVAAFITLWNTSDEFREFWIDLWDNIKEVAGNAWKGIKEFFSNAWTKVKETWGKAKKWFSDIWQSIKKTFSVVGKVLGDFFSAAWTKIKSLWSNSIIGKYFQAIWKTIKGVFAVVKAVLSGNFSDAWKAIKNIVGTWVAYFKDIWNKIKSVFSNVASWFGDKFGAAWKAIKNKFSGWASFWSGLWTKIKDKFGSIGSKIGNAMSDAIKSGLNKVLSLIESTINKGIGLINSAIRLANKLPGVNVGEVPKLSLPRLYQGGVLKRGQVGLLEGKGDEAVVPLHNNKKWISKTAQDLRKSLQKEGVLGGPSGSTASVNNYNFYQTNNSPKALSRLEIYRQTQNQLNFAKGV